MYRETIFPTTITMVHLYQYTHWNGTKCWITTNIKNPQFHEYYRIVHILACRTLKLELTVNSNLKTKTTFAILADLEKCGYPISGLEIISVPQVSLV